ncbi:MAG TPA: hypothetical protein VHM48_14500 [Candidatus Limnocylindrales bacterium]|nr:hypothetical protein [Candidatus Limnocylindrales bacterium]
MTTSHPAPTHVPSASPREAIDPFAWTKIGEMPYPGGELLKGWFSAGYLALGWVEQNGDLAPVASFSRDGRTWRSADLTTPVTPCPGWTARPDGSVADGWAAGGGAVFVGMETVLHGETCDQTRPVAWISSDGLDWTRTHAFEPAGLPITYPTAVWTTPSGWETALKETDDRTWLWQSADAATWERRGMISANPDLGLIVVANDGTRVVVASDDAGRSRLLSTSTDGRTWRAIAGPPVVSTGPGDDWQVIRVLAPDGPAPFWTVVASGEEGPDAHATIWTSADLETWQSGRFPMPSISALGVTSDGILALGTDPCSITGSACPPTRPPRWFRSLDGLTWLPLASTRGPDTLMEGPAGTIGIGAPSGNGRPAPVYRLERR